MRVFFWRICSDKLLCCVATLWFWLGFFFRKSCQAQRLLQPRLEVGQKIRNGGKLPRPTGTDMVITVPGQLWRLSAQGKKGCFELGPKSSQKVEDLGISAWFECEGLVVPQTLRQSIFVQLEFQDSGKPRFKQAPACSLGKSWQENSVLEL